MEIVEDDGIPEKEDDRRRFEIVPTGAGMLEWFPRTEEGRAGVAVGSGRIEVRGLLAVVPVAPKPKRLRPGMSAGEMEVREDEVCVKGGMSISYGAKQTRCDEVWTGQDVHSWTG